METGIKVGDCMKTSLVTVSGSATIISAAKKMAESGVSSLLVTNQRGIYGIVTERDLVVKALANNNTSFLVRDICTKTLITIPMEEDISVAARLMGQRNVKRLVVMHGTKIVGIVSQKDLISISPSLYDFISEAPVSTKLKVY